METKGSRGFHLMFNYENKVLQDKNIRLALNYAVDKDEMLKKLNKIKETGDKTSVSIYVYLKTTIIIGKNEKNVFHGI